MKNRKALYILLPLVALIWGIVIWKVFAYKPSSQNVVYKQYPAEMQAEADTSRYVLMAGYKDPFLRSSRISMIANGTETNKKNNNIKQVKINGVTDITKPANLVYHGLIDGNHDRIGLLEIGEKKLLIEEKSIIGAYSILSVEPDTLIIIYQEKEFAYGKK